MSSYLVLINPHAAGGAAVSEWHAIEAEFVARFGKPQVVVTRNAAEISQHIQQAAQAGISRVISVGGDGTNHSVINSIVQHNRVYPENPLVYGALPAGTGQDWARGLGMPLNMHQALDWLAQAPVRPIDVGHVRYDDEQRYFLNISSAGISHDVVQRVESMNKRRPWTFLLATVRAILEYQPDNVRIELDGQIWYEGSVYLVAVANGRYFGAGIKIAPEAVIDDGLLDVIVVMGVSRIRLLTALQTAYDGTHIYNSAVMTARAHTIRITGDGSARGMDLDGEPAAGHDLHYTVQSGGLTILG